MVAVFVPDRLVSRVQARGQELRHPAGAVFRAHARRLGPASGLYGAGEVAVWSLVPARAVHNVLLLARSLAPDLVPDLMATLDPDQLLRFADVWPASFPGGR